jgi:hypothetical protein
MNKYKLGRIIDHDTRSLEYMFDTSGLSIIDVEHTRLVPVFNQGQVGSCTGNAGNGAINTSPFTLNSKVYSPDETGAVHLYSDAEKIDGGVGYPPEDKGSSGLSIAKALSNAGLISSYQHTFTLNDCLKALSVYPCILGMNWYSNGFTPDLDGRVHPTGTLEGGHEVLAYKVDVELGRVWFWNSWGSNWGVNGTFYLSWADLETLLSQGGDCTVLIPPTHVIAPTTWKYFTSTESTGGGHTVAELKIPLVNLLDQARGIAGIPFIITSGFRTVAENQAAGGVVDSAHLTGEAADLACSDSVSRLKILKALLLVGFNRIEVATGHLHCDISKTLPQNVCVVSIND